jgi:PPOX class probable F420-dependent enzyme
MRVYTDEQRQFLTDNKQAVLATGRADGSPQVSTVVYAVDGDDVLVSTKSYTAKWKNALRQPRVAVLVNEGRRQLVIYGAAESIDSDPERARLTAMIFEAMSGNSVEPESIIPMLDQQKRTILRIKVDKVMMND